jgi:hypothetical protein
VFIANINYIKNQKEHHKNVSFFRVQINKINDFRKHKEVIRISDYKKQVYQTIKNRG